MPSACTRQRLPLRATNAAQKPAHQNSCQYHYSTNFPDDARIALIGPAVLHDIATGLAETTEEGEARDIMVTDLVRDVDKRYVHDTMVCG